MKFFSSTYSIHFSDCACMSPVTIVNRHESQALVFAVQARKHHVTRVQRVYEVWWKCVLLLHRIRSAVKETRKNKYIDY